MMRAAWIILVLATTANCYAGPLNDRCEAMAKGTLNPMTRAGAYLQSVADPNKFLNEMRARLEICHVQHCQQQCNQQGVCWWANCE